MEGGAGGGGVKNDYKCSQVIGLVVTSEWFNGGFETVVPNATWELKAAHMGYVQEWAQPNGPFWATPVTSECAAGSTAPDRVVFTAMNWTYTTEKQWEDDVNKDVDTIVAKYPSVKHIDLLTALRCASTCGTLPAPGPDAATCIVRKVADDGLAAVAAARPSLVSVGPMFEDTDCSHWPNLGSHLTSDANKAMAQQIGSYFLTH